MYEYESWTLKKAEQWKINAFELWCWRRLLRVPWTARRSNQSILQEISPEYSLEGLMLKWKLQYLQPPDMKNWLTGKDLDARKDWKQEEKGTAEDEMVGWPYWLNGHGFGWTLGVGDGQGGLVCCGSWGCKELDMTEQLNWAELKYDITSANPGRREMFSLYVLSTKELSFTVLFCNGLYKELSLWSASQRIRTFYS